MHRSARIAVAALAIGTLGLAGCGSDGESSPSSDVRTADYQLDRWSDLGRRSAWVTLTSRTDGKTTAVVDFFVVRSDETRDDLYPVALVEGDCASPGAVLQKLGTVSAGISTVLLDETLDDLTGPVAEGAAFVIYKPDGKTVAWCGATLTTGKPAS